MGVWHVLTLLTACGAHGIAAKVCRWWWSVSCRLRPELYAKGKQILVIGVHRNRIATSVCQLGHDQMEQGPTEPHIGRSMFLLGSGGAGVGITEWHLIPADSDSEAPIRR